MRRKTIEITVAVLVLTLVGCIVWNLRDLPQQRLLNETEKLVFIDADSTEHLLEQVDTTHLTESTQMLYDLMRALVHEEQWYLNHTDTTSCLWSDAETWNFKREADNQEVDNQGFSNDSTLQRIFRYYEEASLGGTSDDNEALRRFGRICFVLSRHQGDNIRSMQANRLFHLAIHCAETSNDYALAYRVYDRFANHISYKNAFQSEQIIRRALELYRQAQDQPRWLLTILNDYGFIVVHNSPFDLHHFGSMERIINIAARHREESSKQMVLDSIYQRLDSLWTLPRPDFSHTMSLRGYKFCINGEINVPIRMYEETQQKHKEDETKHRKATYDNMKELVEQEFSTNRDTSLAPGYALKSAMLQRKLMITTIIILVLAVLVLILVFWNWYNHVQRQHEAEQAVHLRETEQLAERLRQKNSTIAMLRGHIMDKSEILDMLEPASGKRTIINARNWREIEMTLDTADNNFVSRLRAKYPQFSEDDLRLCMLSRLQLSNTALSAIYVISVSAVQHRKQKLKKEGFGVNDSNITLDQIIANF